MKLRQIYLGFVVGLVVGILLALGICGISEKVFLPGERPSGSTEFHWDPKKHPGQDLLPPLPEGEFIGPHLFIGPIPRPTPTPPPPDWVYA